MSDFLPLEIVKEILIRLPVEALVRCTCVCKQWYSLITSSHFITTHLSFSGHRNPSLLILRRFNENLRTQTFSFHYNTKTTPHDSLPIYNNAITTSPFKASDGLFFRIVGCVDGVVCLSDDLFGHRYIIILWNPFIKRFILLPKPDVVFKAVGPYMFVLGFGYDAKSNDYKVIRISYIQSGDNRAPDKLPPRVEIYSVKQGYWREIKATGVVYMICEPGWSQCFVNGCVHWISFEKKMGSICNLILLFDLGEERFKKMKLPETLVRVCPMTLVVTEIGGSLGVLAYFVDVCEIWIRKEYGCVKSWSKCYCIDLELGSRVLGLRDNGEFLICVKDGNLLSYDAGRKESFDLGIHGMRDAFYVGSYTQSLVLLDKESGSVSYGGAKKNQRSVDSSRKKVKEPSSILVSEETDSEERGNSPISARNLVDMHKAIKISYQMAKFDGLVPEGENN